MNTIVYEAYIEGTDIKAEFELPENATIYEKRFEADLAIKRAVNIRFRKKDEYDLDVVLDNLN